MTRPAPGGYPWGMARPINKKIEMLLRDRDFDEKDLASALGLTGQHLKDILKGRSGINVQVLQGLVEFFGLRADYWINDQKEDPTHEDQTRSNRTVPNEKLEKLGLTRPEGSEEFQRKVREFIRNHPEEWASQFGPLSREEMDLLGE